MSYYKKYNRVVDDDLLKFMGEQESQYLIKPKELTELVIARFDYKKIENKGYPLPWSKTHNFFRLRKNEITLWAGYSSSGKSTLLGMIAAWGLKQKWLIASMEMKPEITIERMVKQIAGTENPTNEYIEKTMDWIHPNLTIYDQDYIVKSEKILALVRYAAEYQFDHIVIDSLIMCGIRKQDFDGQSEFVEKLCWLKKKHPIHIHLVHHLRKDQASKNENKIPSRSDIRGASEITDLVDNVIIIHKIKTKKSEKDHDCVFKVDKQRNYSWEGSFGFWFHPCGQFTGDQHKLMTHWINI